MGISIKWIPLCQFSPCEFKIAANTFKVAFPYCVIWGSWIDSFRPIAALVGTKRGPSVDFKLLQYKIEKAGMREQLEKVGDVSQALSYFLMSNSVLSTYSKGTPINTDNYPIIEFSTPQISQVGASTLNIIDLYENR